MADRIETIINRTVIDPAMFRLPSKMDSRNARIMLLAIGLQESRLIYRRQIGGPARGLWQFEQGGGVKGVLNHNATRLLAKEVCACTRVLADPMMVYAALERDDILAAQFARLLLWTDARALPSVTDVEGAWQCYIWNWRPGKPHRDSWNEFHQRAVEATA